MKPCLTLILFLIAIVLTAGPAAAKTFYLRDGSSIEYKKMWREGDRIFVLVNRDTLVDFAPEEVDQRKTLKAARLKKFPRLTVKKRNPAPAEGTSAPKAAPGKGTNAAKDPLSPQSSAAEVSQELPEGRIAP